MDTQITSPWPASCQWRPAVAATTPDVLSQDSDTAFTQLLEQYSGSAHAMLQKLKPALFCSPWAMEWMIRKPEWFAEMLYDIEQPITNADKLQTLDASVSEQDAMHVLRRQRQQMLVRIALRDLMGWAPLEETLSSLSAFAAASIQSAVDYARLVLQPRFGVPRDGEGREQHLITLGMGKLGGGELNFSSDIDLILLYPDGGQTDGAKCVENQTYFIRLGQLVIKLLDDLTADGFVFRVDMRLRPFGDSGALAVSFAAAEQYYQNQGREWERYAMIKAKALTGQDEDIRRFQQLLKPFVFRRYLDFTAIQSLRELKRMIRDQVQRKGMHNNIKLGRGGIREVEFIGQAFQLIYGGKNPALQQRGIVTILQQLNADKLLEPNVVDALLKAYTFLRLAENRLQMVNDGQTHDLPDSELGQIRLAYSMGFESWEIFLEELEQHRDVVATQFAAVFAESQDSEATNNWAMLWAMEPDDDTRHECWQQALGEAGLDDVNALTQRVLALRDASLYTKATQEAQQRVDVFMPALLSSLSALEKVTASERAAALRHGLDFVRAVVRRSVYLVLLQENPHALRQLLAFFAQSAWMAEQLTQAPALLDQLLDQRVLFSLNERPALDQQLADQLSMVNADNPENMLNALRQFKRTYTLSVAAVDVTDHLPLMRVSDHLTQCAEVLVEEVHRQAWIEMTSKNGFPHCRTEDGVQNPSMAVIGYGKLGGIELGYSSDLDVVFLHDSRGEKEYTSGRDDGKGVIDNTLFFARLAQKFSSMMNAQTRDGQLYEVDTRLRPDGNSGEWVKSLDGFERYQREKAWTWEHQALVRARFISGSPALKARFELIRIQILRQQRDRKQLLKEVVDMREKMRENLGGRDGLTSLKQDRGGLTDIEFMVQYAVLAWAHEHEALTQWTDNIRLLEVMAQVGVMAQQDSDTLIESYRVIRAKIHRLALDKRKAQVADLGELAPVMAAVAAIWQCFMIA